MSSNSVGAQVQSAPIVAYCAAMSVQPESSWPVSESQSIDARQNDKLARAEYINQCAIRKCGTRFLHERSVHKVFAANRSQETSSNSLKIKIQIDRNCALAMPCQNDNSGNNACDTDQAGSSSDGSDSGCPELRAKTRQVRSMAKFMAMAKATTAERLSELVEKRLKAARARQN